MIQQLKYLKALTLKLIKGVCHPYGASGSGKTTLLTILGGLLSQTSGDVLYDEKQLFINGKDTQFRLNDIGFIFQSSHLIPYLTVEEQLLIVGKEAECLRKVLSLEQHNYLII